MAPPALNRSVRVRKLGRSTAQPVLTEDEIDSAEYRNLLTQFASVGHVSNGVESGEAEVFTSLVREVHS